MHFFHRFSQPADTNTEIWLDDLSCFFFDLTLLDCRHSGIGVENCVHAEDVALICETEDRYGPTTDVESRWSYCGLR